MGLQQAEDFRVIALETYQWNEHSAIRERRVIDAIFFCSSEQITLARRFISGWMMEVDATIGTNDLRMPLSVCVGIINTSKTFPACYCFILGEREDAFTFQFRCMDRWMAHISIIAAYIIY